MNRQLCQLHSRTKQLILGRMMSKIVMLTCFSLCVIGGERSTHKPLPSYLGKNMHSTKSAYEFSRSFFKEFASHVGILEKETDEEADVSHDKSDKARSLFPDKCKLEGISLIVRHGARYPSGGDIRRISKLTEKINSLEINRPFSKLKDWKNYFSMETSKMLSESGEKEIVDIAHRYVDLFPELFHAVKGSVSNTFEVMASSTKRAVASAVAFAKGLSRRLHLDQKELTSMISQRDDLLKFAESCSRYLHHVSCAELRVYCYC